MQGRGGGAGVCWVGLREGSRGGLEPGMGSVLNCHRDSEGSGAHGTPPNATESGAGGKDCSVFPPR